MTRCCCIYRSHVFDRRQVHRGGTMRSNCMTNFWPWSSTARLRRSCTQTCLQSGLDMVDGVLSLLLWLSCSPFAQLTMLWKDMRA